MGSFAILCIEGPRVTRSLKWAGVSHFAVSGWTVYTSFTEMGQEFVTASQNNYFLSDERVSFHCTGQTFIIFFTCLKKSIFYWNPKFPLTLHTKMYVKLLISTWPGIYLTRRQVEWKSHLPIPNFYLPRTSGQWETSSTCSMPIQQQTVTIFYSNCYRNYFAWHILKLAISSWKTLTKAQDQYMLCNNISLYIFCHNER